MTRGRLRAILDRIYQAIFPRLDTVFPRFGFKKVRGNWVATKWPGKNFDREAKTRRPARLVVYANRPWSVKIHGRKGVTLVRVASGAKDLRGKALTRAIRKLCEAGGVPYPENEIGEIEGGLRAVHEWRTAAAAAAEKAVRAAQRGEEAARSEALHGRLLNAAIVYGSPQVSAIALLLQAALPVLATLADAFPEIKNAIEKATGRPGLVDEAGRDVSALLESLATVGSSRAVDARAILLAALDSKALAQDQKDEIRAMVLRGRVSRALGPAPTPWK